MVQITTDTTGPSLGGLGGQRRYHWEVWGGAAPQLVWRLGGHQPPKVRRIRNESSVLMWVGPYYCCVVVARHIHL